MTCKRKQNMYYICICIVYDMRHIIRLNLNDIIKIVNTFYSSVGGMRFICITLDIKHDVTVFQPIQPQRNRRRKHRKKEKIKIINEMKKEKIKRLNGM